MSSVEALVALGSKAESQNGYVTAAQAVDVGVSRSRLSKLATAGALRPVSRGVYRMVGAPGILHEEVYANFLALRDRAVAPDSHIAGLVVAGESATLLHGIGGYWGNRIDLISQAPLVTQRAGVRVEQIPLTARDIVTVDGMPVLSGAATVADLVRRGGDWSIIADALMDGLQFGIVDLSALVSALDRLPSHGSYGDGGMIAAALLGAMKMPRDQVSFYERQLPQNVRKAA